MKIILLFDSNDVKENDKYIKLSNTTEELEDILSTSPIVDGDNLVGYVLSAENKTGASLFYGNVKFINADYNEENTKIVNYDVIFKEPPVNGIYDVLMIAIIVKKV